MLELSVVGDGGSQLLWQQGSAGNFWMQWQSAHITGHITRNDQVSFRGHASSFRSDMAVDDLRIYPGACQGKNVVPVCKTALLF